MTTELITSEEANGGCLFSRWRPRRRSRRSWLPPRPPVRDRCFRRESTQAKCWTCPGRLTTTPGLPPASGGGRHSCLWGRPPPVWPPAAVGPAAGSDHRCVRRSPCLVRAGSGRPSCQSWHPESNLSESASPHRPSRGFQKDFLAEIRSSRVHGPAGTTTSRPAWIRSPPSARYSAPQPDTTRALASLARSTRPQQRWPIR
jgi:hypothetical protein